MNRCFPNPTYEMNTTAEGPSKAETEATYDVVACPGQTQPGITGNGQTYAKLNRPKRYGESLPTHIIMVCMTDIRCIILSDVKLFIMHYMSLHES